MTSEAGTHVRENHGAGAGFAVLIPGAAPRQVPSRVQQREAATVHALNAFRVAEEDYRRVAREMARVRRNRRQLAAIAHEAGVGPAEIARIMGTNVRQAHKLITQGYADPRAETRDRGEETQP